jgi:hypothetical protein
MLNTENINTQLLTIHSNNKTEVWPSRLSIPIRKSCDQFPTNHGHVVVTSQHALYFLCKQMQ